MTANKNFTQNRKSHACVFFIYYLYFYTDTNAASTTGLRAHIYSNVFAPTYRCVVIF